MTAMTAPTGDLPAPVEARGHFFGSRRECWRILARDTLALIVTLGLYRFWVTTNVRRYMWSRTDLAGEQLDYTGDPAELLLGFLGLVVVLAPLIVLSALLSWATGDILVVVFTTYVPVILLALLAVLALYQARRYRVNHTVFRGLRFRQTGSAWIYLLLVALWSVVVVATLGLAYPWARASLERYKARHTHFGDLRASFVGSGWDLFKRGFFLWLVVWSLPLLLLLAGLGAGDSGSRPQVILGLSVLAVPWLALMVMIFYPFFRAMALRWRIAGMRLGALSLKADFRVWSFAKPYFKFYAWLVLLAIVVAILGLAALVVIAVVARSIVTEVIGVVCLVIAYFGIATLMAFAYQATVRLETWRIIVDSLVISGVDQLDRIKAPPDHDSPRTGRIGAAINLGGF